jgi:hypothetical protein
MNWDSYTPEERLNICGVPFPKVTVCRREHYEIQYEQLDGHTFVHVNVKGWSPTVKDDFTRDCDALQELLDGPVMVLCTNSKLRRFCEMFGFVHLMDAVTNEGTPATVLIRNKKQHGAEPLRRRHEQDQLGHQQ